MGLHSWLWFSWCGRVRSGCVWLGGYVMIGWVRCVVVVCDSYMFGCDYCLVDLCICYMSRVGVVHGDIEYVYDAVLGIVYRLGACIVL